MKKARELLLEFTASSFRITTEAAAMFAEDGVFEMPYLADFGIPSRYEGNAKIAASFQIVRDLYPGFEFQNVSILIDTPEQVFAEYEFTARSSRTGRTIHQLFLGRLVAANGQIKLLREALNSVRAALAFYERGVPELPTSPKNE